MLVKIRSEKLEVGSGKRKDGRCNFNYKAILFGLFFMFIGISSYSQCAMCRAALGGEQNKVQAEAVNDGIVYLMVIPYLLVAGIGYAIYRMQKKNK